jgi:hypothetical protein
MSPTRNESWPVLIGILVQVKQTLAQVDGGLWPYHYPEVKATEQILGDTERKLGLRLAPSYREFLLHSDGWKGFFQTVDLLGSEELIAGPHRAFFDASYGVLRDEEWRAIGLERGRTLPFGISLQDKDAFVFDLTQEREWEFRIVWLAGGVVDEWTSFTDFFKSMIEYNRREVRQFSQA